MEEVKLGDILFLKPVNNQVRYTDGIVEVKVVKVGRKYFYVEPTGESHHWAIKGAKFFIDDLTQDGGSYVRSWVVYRSMQAVEDEKLAMELYRDIKNHFSRINPRWITLDQLREIHNILLNTCKQINLDKTPK